jgi:hypothetical protein
VRVYRTVRISFIYTQGDQCDVTKLHLFSRLPVTLITN